MRDKLILPSAGQTDESPEKSSNLAQVLIIITSGILSSSAVAAVVKAWLDNRRTRLTVQIDGEKRTLEYEGHHLEQDAPLIQHVVETLNTRANSEQSLVSVTIDPEFEGKTEKYMLEAGTTQQQPVDAADKSASEQTSSSRLKRLLLRRTSSEK